MAGDNQTTGSIDMMSGKLATTAGVASTIATGSGVLALGGAITMAAWHQVIGAEICAAAMLSAIFVVSVMTMRFG